MKTRTTADWEERLRRAEVPYAPVWDYARLFASPQVLARNLRVTVRDPQGQEVDLLGTPFHIGGATRPTPTMPPELGQHTEWVLNDLLGIPTEEIARLRQQGIV